MTTSCRCVEKVSLVNIIRNVDFLASLYTCKDEEKRNRTRLIVQAQEETNTHNGLVITSKEENNNNLGIDEEAECPRCYDINVIF